MNVRCPLLAVVLLGLSLFACRSGEEPAADGSGGTGGDATGGNGGDPCEPVVAQALLADGAPPRIYGLDRTRPERIAGSFSVASPEPVEGAREALRRLGPGVGLRDDGADLEVASVKRGLAGTYVRFGQRHLGLPVFHREVVVHVVPEGRGALVKQVRFDHARMPPGLGIRAKISVEAAEAAARAAVGADELDAPVLGFLELDGNFRLVYRTLAGRRDPPGSWELFVDAGSGAVVRVTDLLRHVDGSGLVFDPNPVASTGNSFLQDRGNETYAELDAARVRVTLPRLDGSGYLRGQWVDVRGRAADVHSPDLVFDFDRSQDGFEGTMAYFHVDRVQARLQELGFTDVLNRPQVVNVNDSPAENSWYDPRTREITTGRGGVDDAEDADVIVHEYGHAIQGAQTSMFSGGDGGALGEGFGDYLAASIADTFSPQVIDPACLGEWNATAYASGDPPCLRRLDEPKHFPEALGGEVHDDGEIWAAVLWELRGRLGADVVDRLVIESHFSYSFSESFTGAAEALLEADRALYGGRHLDVLVPVLTHRGLLRTPVPPAIFPDVLQSLDVDVRSPRRGDLYPDRLDHTEEIRVPGAAGLRLHFVEIGTELNDNCRYGACDNIYLTSDAGHLYQILNGNHRDVPSVAVPGEAIHVRLVTNRRNGDFGYRIGRVDVLGYRTCGNGLRDGAEACDGADLAGASCETLGFVEGSLACGADCRLDVSGCLPAPGCGDGVVGAGEECDGADVGGATCGALGLGAGRVTCTAACRLDTSGCSSCGNGIREGAEGCDGADLAGLTCEALGLGPGALGCSEACTLDTSGCLPAGC
jgi:hypothetical protein